LLASSGTVPLAKIHPWELIVTADDSESASLLLDRVIGSAPAIWVYVTGHRLLFGEVWADGRGTAQGKEWGEEFDGM